MTTIKNPEFKVKWESECGVQITSRCPNTNDVQSVECLFCRAFGKEEPDDKDERKRKRSQKIQTYSSPWRCDKMKNHNCSMHPKKWSEYQNCSKEDKERFFDNNALQIIQTQPAIRPTDTFCTAGTGIGTGTISAEQQLTKTFKPFKNSDFNAKWEIELGVKIISRCPRTDVVQSVVCLFCRTFGKEESEDNDEQTRKRKRYQKLQTYNAPWRYDKMKNHNCSMHATKWVEYLSCSQEDKVTFFDNGLKYSNNNTTEELTVPIKTTRSPNFKLKWELDCGIQITSRCPHTQVVQSVECLFCRTFGKEEPENIDQRKRKRSQRIQTYSPPWRCDKMKNHNSFMHATKWAEYQNCGIEEKRRFFTKKIKSTNTTDFGTVTKKIKRSTDFKEKWELECGIQITSRCLRTGAVQNVVCLFCRAFGKDEPNDADERKRKRSQKLQTYSAPWRIDKMKKHNSSMHSAKWSEYQNCGTEEKKRFFNYALKKPSKVERILATTHEKERTEK